MRWQQGRRSDNVEDRRGQTVARGFKLSGGLILIVVVFSLLTGQNPLRLMSLLMQQDSTQTTQPSGAPQAPEAGDEQAQFVSVVLADTEDTWGSIFAQAGRQYTKPTLVLFTGEVQSACGFTSSAVGPFYCPADSKVYIDLGFFRELDQRFGAPGDFAQAYVVAHEVGHHVQNLLGISDRVSRAQQSGPEAEANSLSVRMELQADCFAGVWGHYAGKERNLLEPGDVEEGLKAAAAIGDDRIQKESQGYVVPESWTHGSSQMRVQWLRRGLDSGSLDSCDTFQKDIASIR